MRWEPERQTALINRQLTLSADDISAFCKQHLIRRLSLFGSVLRDDFTRDSDVDVLVEFEPGARVGYFELADMMFELEDLLGRKVDLLTPEALSPYFRQKVLDTARVIYERK
ncbi:MAG: nucleotidyltransferase family protein [Anaerolineae bacterium]|nr:nucleotidyltransferase family protein [Anaerolineae bacterium]